MKKNSSHWLKQKTPTFIVIAIAHVVAMPAAEAATILLNGNGDNSANCTLREAIATMNVAVGY